MEGSQRRTELILKLEGELRARHRHVRNAFATLVHPHRLNVEQLEAGLRPLLRTVVEHNDADCALAVVAALGLSDLKTAHPKVGMGGVENAYSHLTPTVIMGTVDFGKTLDYGAPGVGGGHKVTFAAPVGVDYKNTEANREAAIQVVKALLEADAKK